MRYEFLTNIGGFLWWLTIKFGRTDLKDEQLKINWARNLFYLIVLGLIVAFVFIKII